MTNLTLFCHKKTMGTHLLHKKTTLFHHPAKTSKVKGLCCTNHPGFTPVKKGVMPSHTAAERVGFSIISG